MAAINVNQVRHGFSCNAQAMVESSPQDLVNAVIVHVESWYGDLVGLATNQELRHKSLQKDAMREIIERVCGLSGRTGMASYCSDVPEGTSSVQSLHF